MKSTSMMGFAYWLGEPIGGGEKWSNGPAYKPSMYQTVIAPML
jgi:hypothetical protein